MLVNDGLRKFDCSLSIQHGSSPRQETDTHPHAQVTRNAPNQIYISCAIAISEVQRHRVLLDPRTEFIVRVALLRSGEEAPPILFHK